MHKAIFTLGALLHFSVLAVAQVSSVDPVRPSSGGKVVLSYDAGHKDASLSGEDGIFATVQIVTASGKINRAVPLQPAEDGKFEAACQIPDDASYLKSSFATRWAVDPGAAIQRMVWGDDGKPVRGARVHGAFAQRSRCLEVLAEELESYPDSFWALRTKWAYSRLLRRGKYTLDEVRADLETVGNSRTPDALLARVYLHLMCDDEASARTALLAALREAPTHLATAQAVSDYSYFSRAGVGTAAAREQVMTAVRDVMTEHPESHLVRDQLYNQWPRLSFDAVKNLVAAWSAEEPRNPLPAAILAASSLARDCEPKRGGDAARKALNGFLKGDARIASLETQGLEDVYMPWCFIVAAKLAQRRGDAVLAIGYAKAYSSSAGRDVVGYECEADVWEELRNTDRARDCWLQALAGGSTKAKAALRRIWEAANGSDDGFEADLGAQLATRRAARDRPKVPDFECTDIDGEVVRSDSLQGRVTVLNFWSLGCQPCKKEIPFLNKVVEAFKGKPVEFLAVSMDSPAAVATYVEEQPFAYRLITEGYALQESFDLSSMPLHVVIDSAGRVMAQFTGATNGYPERLAALVELALSEI
ncbi:MAG: peroxiredoxin family protein [Planctomycetota bacterium]